MGYLRQNLGRVILLGILLGSMVGCATESQSTEADDTYYAYGEVLWDIYHEGILPNGQQLDYINLETAAENTFAIYDVDLDDKEELLINWTAGVSMSGTKGIIFGYEDGAVYKKLSEFASMRFFDNGVIEADASHSHGGLAGDFWPYSIYTYDEEEKMYASYGRVDSWDKEVADKNAAGTVFPTEVDVDEDGVIYLIYSDHWDNAIVDEKEFQEWRASYLGDAKAIEIPFQKMTPENIEKLGCPEPEFVVPEPAG